MIQENYGTYFNKKWLFYPITVLLLIIICIIPINQLYFNNNDFLIIAQAASSTNHSIIGNENSELKIDVNYNIKDWYFGKIVTDPNKGSEYLPNEVLDGALNVDIYFVCEGEKITSITYTSEDITFFESKYIPIEIATSSEFIKNNRIVKVNGNSVDDCLVILDLGNSYTVSYNNQKNNQYGMMIPAEWSVGSDYDDITWKKEKINITVKASFENGTEKVKNVEIIPNNMDFGKFKFHYSPK